MKNYFKSTAVVLAVVAFLVQACGDNNKNSTAVAAAGPRGGVDTTGFVESKAMTPADSKISLSILGDNVDVALDGAPSTTVSDKNADGTPADSVTVVATANLTIKNIKVPISLTHQFTKLTDLGLKERSAIQDANDKAKIKADAQKKVDDAKAANDTAQAAAKNDNATPEIKKAAQDAQAALDSANTDLKKATELATSSAVTANAAIDAAKNDKATQDIKTKNAAVVSERTKLNQISGLDYSLDVVGYTPNEASSMYYISVLLTATGKEQVKNSSRGFALAFGVPANQADKSSIAKLAIEDSNTHASDLAGVQMTLVTGLLINQYPPGTISSAQAKDTSASVPAQDQTKKPADATPATDKPADAPAKDSTAAASSVPAAKTGK